MPPKTRSDSQPQSAARLMVSKAMSSPPERQRRRAQVDGDVLLAHRRFRDGDVRGGRGQHERGAGDPEQPVVGEVMDDRAS